ncbi:MAG: helix-turn-helix domain-containing protein [Eubacteriales bacterium]|nr:helix-turn-helix domain-containing protein [Eubacteriales bacterium]
METIIDRITRLLKEKNKMAVDLCNLLNIQQSTMSTWKSRRRNPPAEYMPTIASFLGVTLDYLLTGKDVPPRKTTTDEEDYFLNLYRDLPEREQWRIVGIIEEAHRRSHESDKYLDAEGKLSV